VGCAMAVGEKLVAEEELDVAAVVDSSLLSLSRLDGDASLFPPTRGRTNDDIKWDMGPTRSWPCDDLRVLAAYVLGASNVGRTPP
jgi:hypothetical protein